MRQPSVLPIRHQNRPVLEAEQTKVRIFARPTKSAGCARARVRLGRNLFTASVAMNGSRTEVP